jgi:hypothetical protein
MSCAFSDNIEGHFIPHSTPTYDTINEGDKMGGGLLCDFMRTGWSHR